MPREAFQQSHCGKEELSKKLSERDRERERESINPQYNKLMICNGFVWSH